MGRKVRITLAAAALALLTACGSSGEGGSSDAAPKAPTKTPRQVFLESIHEADFDSWEETGPPDGEIAKFPPKWCAAALVGHSVGWMLAGDDSEKYYPVGWQWGTVLDDAKQIVVMGIGAYCPQQRDAAIEGLHDWNTLY